MTEYKPSDRPLTDAQIKESLAHLKKLGMIDYDPAALERTGKLTYSLNLKNILANIEPQGEA